MKNQTWQLNSKVCVASYNSISFVRSGSMGLNSFIIANQMMANNSFPNDASYAPGRGSAAASRPGPLDD
ncbi:hypothetical protein PSTG_10947 [Puccinia striiformis f. sp. tritici PST-78]|uniref:Uncharacterized protein n=1 Tax=Puccinia striiformis f. sp. tritici PST-78 TaxID=1165861 RepID=A0A0L0V8W6_9BASI|nr:hypothetical protein PSTG_10947 [Puccinia striiformis f. sp. tritici PST-78]